MNWPKTNPQTAVDLDSNLYSPNSAGNGWDRIYYNNNETYGTDTVKLDKDDDEDTAPPGDETITISKVRSGTYKFRVKNYTGGTDNLSNSKAKVKVYYNDGTSSIKKKYYVPNDKGTVWWDVFNFDKNTGFTAYE